jgi:hypothetical protein
VEIDPVTGSALNSVHLDSLDNMVSLAFDVVSGKLYGNTSSGFGADGDELYLIDPLFGTTTSIGKIGFDNVYALGFDQSGNLFGVSDANDVLISVSTLTGGGTFIANMQVGFAFDIASRPEDNTMFLVDSGTTSLYTLNTGNGALGFVGSYAPTANNLVGLAFSPVSRTPEPGVLFLFLTALPGIAALRRKGKEL